MKTQLGKQNKKKQQKQIRYKEEICVVGKSCKKENEKVFTNVIGKLLKTSLELKKKKKSS